MKRTRLAADWFWTGLCLLAVGLAVLVLLAIVADVALKGIADFDVAFFTKLPPLPNAKAPGGLANAIQGSLILVAGAAAFGIPVGIVSGIYISEFGSGLYGSVISFLGDVLAGIPTIVTGILVFTLVVLPLHAFSVVAGSIALGSIMVPVVSSTTAHSLRAVPNSIREGSLALGVGKWRTTLVILGNAKSSVATASLYAVARAMGETAPILLTVGSSSFWFSGAWSPVATLTYYIYDYATSATPNWVALAWTAALVLMLIVLGINAAVRVITRRKTAYS